MFIVYVNGKYRATMGFDSFYETVAKFGKDNVTYRIKDVEDL